MTKSQLLTRNFVKLHLKASRMLCFPGLGSCETDSSRYTAAGSHLTACSLLNQTAVITRIKLSRFLLKQ